MNSTFRISHVVQYLRPLGVSGVGSLSLAVGTAVYFLCAARALGAASFGLLVSGYALAGVAALLAAFGTAQRWLSEPVQPVSWGSVWVVLGLGPVGLGAALVGAVALAVPLEVVFWLYVGLWAVAAANIAQSLLRVRGRHGEDARLRSFGRAVLIMGAIAMMLAGAGPVAFAAVVAVAGVVECAASIWAVRTIPVRRAAVGGVGRAMRLGAPHVVDSFAQRGIGTLDILIVATVAGPVEAGLYALAQKALMMASLVIEPIMNTRVPVMARAWSENRAAWAAFRETLRIGAVAAVLSMAGLGVLAWIGAAGWLGAGYGAVTPLLWVMVPVAGLRIMAACLGISLLAFGFQRRRLRANLVALVIYLVALTVAALGWGSTGAAVGALVLYAVLPVLFVRQLRAAAQGAGRHA